MTHNPDKWHEKIWNYYPITYNPEAYHHLIKWWLDLVPKYGDKIVEVGPYSGLALIWLKLTFPKKDVIGCEINPVVLHMAKTRAYYWLVDVPIYQEDGFKLPFADKSKDVLFSGGLYEHFNEEERKKMIIEHLRVAKYVIFSVPTNEALEDGGGYGDEISLTKQQWISWTNTHFKIVRTDNYLDIYEIYEKKGEICFVLEGVKE